MIDATKGFTIVRVLSATPERIWQAWTRADEVSQWWHPPGSSTPRETVEMNAAAGGKYIYEMVNDVTGDSVVTGGFFIDVEPFEKLSLTWGVPGAHPEDTPLVTVNLDEVDGGTQLTFDLRGVGGSQGDRFLYDGWAGVLDSLQAHVQQG